MQTCLTQHIGKVLSRGLHKGLLLVRKHAIPVEGLGWISPGHKCSRPCCSPAIALTPLSYHHSQICLKNCSQPVIHREGKGRKEYCSMNPSFMKGGLARWAEKVRRQMGFQIICHYFLLCESLLLPTFFCPIWYWLHPISFKQLTDCQKQCPSLFLS